MVPINIALTKKNALIVNTEQKICDNLPLTLFSICYLNIWGGLTFFQIQWMIWSKCEATFKAIENLGIFNSDVR